MQRIIEEEKYKKATEFQLLEYRYRSLQTQINPHFIYNVFETVNALAKLDNNAEVANVIQLISRYFRQSTRNMNARYITLDSEFTSLRDYAEIYRYIYGERVRIEFDCPEKLRKALIPSMVLQPVLENALVHGIKANDDESLIIVSAKEDKDKLLVSIKDHGPGMPEDIKKQILSNDAVDAGAIQSQHHSGIGLRNVIERLRLIYGDLVSFEIDSGSDGTEICITIPVNYIVPENNYDYPI
jgi:sensor histidine kinase YesM